MPSSDFTRADAGARKIVVGEWQDLTLLSDNTPNVDPPSVHL